MRRLAGHLLDLVYPRVCCACGGGVAGADGHICWDCRWRMDAIREPYCERCGDPADGVTGREYRCSACRRDEPAFERARSVVRYRGPVLALLRELKYKGALWMAGELGDMLAGCVAVHYGGVEFHGVMGVPLHASRLRHRTYNQSTLLAAALARRIAVPLAAGSCVERRVRTPTQTGLNAAQRRRNVRGAFRAERGGWLEGRRILLVDDVMTTGATVGECAREMREAGAAAVYVVTLARG